MKIKAKIPYEIKFYITNPNAQMVERKTEKEVISIALQNAQITPEEYAEKADEIRVENIMGDSVTLKQYVQNQIDTYFSTIDDIEKELNHSFIMTYVFPKKDYDSVEEFLNSDEEEIVKIREMYNFVEFADVTEQTDEKKFFIGNKVQQEKTDEQSYYSIITTFDDKKIVIIDTNWGNLIDVVRRDNLPIDETIIIGPDIEEEISNANKIKFDEWAYKYPIFTVLQYESVKTQMDAPIRVDPDKNILLNSKISDFVDVAFDPDEYKMVDGKWVNIGLLQRNVLVPEEEVIKFDYSFDPKKVEDDLFKIALADE